MNNTQFKPGQIPWNKGTKGLMKVNSGSFVKGMTPHNKKPKIRKICKCGKEFYVKPSLDRVKCCSIRCSRLGKTTSAKQKAVARLVAKKYLTGLALGRIPWNKGLYGYLAGEKHFNWKGGTSKYYRIRRTNQYKEWRDSVFKRDNYTCQMCGLNNCYLTAHHIKSISKFFELALDINNGITLCEPCHSQTDNYKGRARKI